MAPFDRWQDAAALLRDQLKLATDLQRELGRISGTSIPKRTPALVAAELLKADLVEPLCLERRGLSSEYQYDYLVDLASECRLKAPARPTYYAVGSAWIKWFLGKRALIHLRRIKPAPGDIVRIAGRNVSASLVSSISRDGRVNLRGLDGGAYPHRLNVLARASATDAASLDLREKANRRLREEARLSPDFAERHTSHLEPYLVKVERSDASVQDLANAVEQSTDEKGPQRIIEEHPALLATLVSASLGVWVIPQKKLGAEFVTDFMLAYRNTTGMHWIAVELESPAADPLIQNGQPGRELRTAEQQIYSWRDWLENNLDYARRAPSDSGLGLTHVRAKVPGLIIIGRRTLRGDYSNVVHRFRSEYNIEIQSYDWLIREASTLGSRGRGGSMNLNEEDLFSLALSANTNTDNSC